MLRAHDAAPGPPFTGVRIQSLRELSNDNDDEDREGEEEAEAEAGAGPGPEAGSSVTKFT
jgi:hypothetical protein